MSERYQCPYDEACKCIMFDPCAGCESFDPTKLNQRSPSDVKLVEAIKVLDPCDKCEWEFDPEYIACPCHHKKVRDEALAEHKQ